MDAWTEAFFNIKLTDYEYKISERLYEALLPRVRIVLSDHAVGEAAVNIQHMLTERVGFDKSGSRSEKIETLIRQTKTDSDPALAINLKTLLDTGHQLTKDFAAAKMRDDQGPDFYTTLSDTYDLVGKQLEPIVAELKQMIAVMNGDCQTFDKHVPLLVKITFTVKTVAAIRLAIAASMTASTLVNQTAAVASSAEAPPVAAAGVATICAEAIGVVAAIGTAISYVMEDIGLWLGKPDTVPKATFDLFGSFAAAKKKLEDIQGDFRQIESNVRGLPAKFSSVSARVKRLIGMA